MIDSFFVYVHRKADTGEIFYVGKGSSRSPILRINVARGRSSFWRGIVAKHGMVAEIVAWFEDEGDAFRLECDLIEHYGRRADGGVLCNLTMGGEGCSGLVMSEETRTKLRSANSGEKAFNYGRKFPKEFGEKKTRSLLSGPHSPVGKKLPEAWCRSISESKRGEKHPMWGKSGIDHPRGQHVFLHGYNLVFGSVREAAKFAGMSLAGLQANLTGKTKVNKTNMELI